MKFSKTIFLASILLFTGCDSNQPKINYYSTFADPDQPQVGRYQLRETESQALIFDTATADMWVGSASKWTKLPNPVRADKDDYFSKLLAKYTNSPTK